MSCHKRRCRWNGAVTVLVEQGFTVGEAALWANAFPHLLIEALAARAVEYRDAGFTLFEALAWCRVVHPATSAVHHANAGWTPALTRALRQRLHHWPCRDESAEEDGWLHTGIRPSWVLRYIDAGVKPEQAIRLEERRATGEDLAAGLSLLGALLSDVTESG